MALGWKKSLVSLQLRHSHQGESLWLNIPATGASWLEPGLDLVAASDPVDCCWFLLLVVFLLLLAAVALALASLALVEEMLGLLSLRVSHVELAELAAAGSGTVLSVRCCKLVLACLDACHLLDWCCFLLFVQLLAAVDLALASLALVEEMLGLLSLCVSPVELAELAAAGSGTVLSVRCCKLVLACLDACHLLDWCCLLLFVQLLAAVDLALASLALVEEMLGLLSLRVSPVELAELAAAGSGTFLSVRSCRLVLACLDASHLLDWCCLLLFVQLLAAVDLALASLALVEEMLGLLSLRVSPVELAELAAAGSGTVLSVRSCRLVLACLDASHLLDWCCLLLFVQLLAAVDLALASLALVEETLGLLSLRVSHVELAELAAAGSGTVLSVRCCKLVLACLDACHLLDWCCFLLFVQLLAVFDLALASLALVEEMLGLLSLRVSPVELAELAAAGSGTVLSVRCCKQVLAFLDACHLLDWCCFLLFVQLLAAVDLALASLALVEEMLGLLSLPVSPVGVGWTGCCWLWDCSKCAVLQASSGLSGCLSSPGLMLLFVVCSTAGCCWSCSCFFGSCRGDVGAVVSACFSCGVGWTGWCWLWDCSKCAVLQASSGLSGCLSSPGLMLLFAVCSTAGCCWSCSCFFGSCRGDVGAAVAACFSCGVGWTGCCWLWDCSKCAVLQASSGSAGSLWFSSWLFFGLCPAVACSSVMAACTVVGSSFAIRDRSFWLSSATFIPTYGRRLGRTRCIYPMLHGMSIYIYIYETKTLCIYIHKTLSRVLDQETHSSSCRPSPPLEWLGMSKVKCPKSWLPATALSNENSMWTLGSPHP